MADVTDKQINFVTDVINTAQAITDAVSHALELRREYDKQNYGITLEPDAFTGENQHASIGNVSDFFFTLQQIETLLESGHWTNLYNLKK